MAINPLIALSVEPPDIAGNYMKGREGAQNAEMNRQKIASAKYQNMTDREKARLSSSLYGAAKLDTYLQSDDLEGAKNFLLERKRNIGARIAEGEDIDTTETDDALRMINAGEVDKLKNITSKALSLGRMTGIFKTDVNSGGATGELVDRYMQATGMPFDQALYAVQTGMRQGLGMQDGQIVPLAGVPEAKGKIKLGETAGKEEAETIYARPKEREKQIGQAEGEREGGRGKALNALKAMEANNVDMFGSEDGKVKGLIDDVIPRVNVWTAGFTGKRLADIPGTDAANLRADLDTIKASIGFEELQEMRNNSPTGGALGSTTEREIMFLQNKVRNLENSQSPQQLNKNLRELKTAKQRSFKRIQEAYERDYGGRTKSGMARPPTVEDVIRRTPAGSELPDEPESSFNGNLPPLPEGFEIIQ